MDDIGKQLKELRSLHKLSQRELAKRAGVTNSAVSLIELNQVSPSVASLKKILDAFPISLEDFFTRNLKTTEQVVFKKDELVELGNDNVSLKLVGASLKGRTIQILQETYAPGGDTGIDMLMSKNEEEGGVILKGRIELTVGDQVHILKKGDSYYFKCSLPHRFRNIGRGPAEIFSAATRSTGGDRKM